MLFLDFCGNRPPVCWEECCVLFIFQVVQLVKIFALKPVFMGLLSSFYESFLDEWGGRGRLLRDYTVLAEDVVPRNDEIGS